MYQRTKLILVFSMTIALAGCGKSYPTVSGKVTMNGEPVSKIEVVFAPKSTEDTPIVGPVSFATTDSNGQFSLRTKDGSTGAVAGHHAVGFRWPDASGNSLQSLESAYKEVKKTAPLEAEEIARKIEALKQTLSERPQLPGVLETDFEVAAGGTTEANFELSDLKEPQR